MSYDFVDVDLIKAILNSGESADSLLALRDLIPVLKESLIEIKELLSQESPRRAEREKFLAEFDGSSESLRRRAEAIDREIADDARITADTQTATSNVQAEEQKVLQQIQKRQVEAERLSRRLANMRQVQPVFVDEMKEVEAQVEALRGSYIEKFRNLTFLQHLFSLVDEEERGEREHQEKWLEMMKRKNEQEDFEIMRSGGVMTGGSRSNGVSHTGRLSVKSSNHSSSFALSSHRTNLADDAEESDTSLPDFHGR
jgi:hypothetical protein